MKKIIFLLLFLTGMKTVSYSQTPTFTWAKANYGATNDEAKGVAIDNEQNIIEIGSFKSYFTGGQFNLQGNILPQSPMDPEWNNYYNDEYLAKYNSSGDLLWYKRTEGTKIENVQSVTTDSDNNIYVCGTYSISSTLNNVTLFSVSVPNVIPGIAHAYLMKLSPTGSVLWFQTVTLNYPTNSTSTINTVFQFESLKIDGAGNVYASALFGVDSVSVGNFTLNHVFGSPNQYRNEACIFKFDTNGNPVWLKGIQGAEDESISKIDVDVNGNIYFSGGSGSGVVNVSGTNYSTGPFYNFTAKMDTNGEVVWLDFNSFAFLETTSDSNGNVYAVGYAMILPNDTSTHTYTFGPDTVTIPYVMDVRRDNVMIVCKYSSTGDELWMRASPGNIYMRGKGIEIDANDNTYIMGQYVVPTTFGGFTLPNSDFISNSYSLSEPEYKTFVAKITASGNVDWLKQTGNHFRLETADFEVDNYGSIVLVGKFMQGNSINFDDSLLTGYNSGSSFRDSYIAKFNTVAPGTTPVITTRSNPFGLALDATNKLYIAESGISDGNRISRATLTDAQPIASPLFTTGLNKPTRLKWSIDNYLYATETGANEISRANLGIASPVMQSYFNNGLSQPMGLDVVGTNLFVGDFGSTSVKNIDTSVTPFQVNTHVIDYASDIVNDGISMYFVNNSSTNVYAANILDADAPIVVIAEGMTKPSSLLLHNNMLYISDSTDGAIYRINPYGGSTSPQLLISGLNAPNGMVVYNNNLYIAETGANRVVTFSLGALSTVDNENEVALFSVAPNPTSDFLHFEIDSEIDSVEVFDVSGNLILKENSLVSNSLSVSSLSSGLYFVKITSLDKSQTKKIIKF